MCRPIRSNVVRGPFKGHSRQDRGWADSVYFEQGRWVLIGRCLTRKVCQEVGPFGRPGTVDANNINGNFGKLHISVRLIIMTQILEDKPARRAHKSERPRYVAICYYFT